MYQNPYYYSPFFLTLDSNMYFFNCMSIQNQCNIDSNLETKTQPNQSKFIQNFPNNDEKVLNTNFIEDQLEKNVFKPVLNERNTKENVDQQYNPNSKLVGKSRKQHQNQMRNVIPNIIHQIISFIQKPTKSKGIIQKLIQREENPNFTLKRFFLYQKLLKDKINYYVNAKTLELLIRPMQIDSVIFPKQQVLFYCQISRIVIKTFLKQESNCLILTSSKIKTSNKILHLKAHRILLQMLNQ